MANLDNTTKFKLESLLDMSTGYVLDFSNDTFADFVRTSIGFDPYERYGATLSKAKLLRAIWEQEPDVAVACLNLELLERWYARKGLTNESLSGTQEALHQELSEQFKKIAVGASGPSSAGAPAAFTTEASVTANKIEIEIHEDIYDHIARYLAHEDYFHAVEEAYKVVREALREKTGSEKATDAFKPDNQTKIFGHPPANQAESDFFDGVKYLNMAIQFLRNEKSHTLAAPMERNLALHYISLASLSYDLITRYVSEELIEGVENLVEATRREYSARRFYPALESGAWMESLALPSELKSPSVRRVLKDKWLDDADFTRSYNHSNVVLMLLMLVVSELAPAEIDALLDLPTVDSYGNDQQAGMMPFLEFIATAHPEKLSTKASEWIAANGRD